MTTNAILTEGAFDASARKTANDNFGDLSRCTTQLDATSNTTLANITGMVTDVLPVGTYRVKINLNGTSGAAGGTKIAFKFGTPSMLSALDITARAFTASGVAVTRATTATDQASLQAATAANINVELVGTVTVSVPGYLQLQAAQNASNATTTSIYTSSVMEVYKIA